MEGRGGGQGRREEERGGEKLDVEVEVESSKRDPIQIQDEKQSGVKGYGDRRSTGDLPRAREEMLV
eukprot:759473-Hanusia_phi.AAC.3